VYRWRRPAPKRGADQELKMRSSETFARTLSVKWWKQKSEFTLDIRVNGKKREEVTRVNNSFKNGGEEGITKRL
jgi:hypothetical protein